MATASRILGVEVGSTAPAFLAILAIHVIAGLTAVITGAAAALARKGSPRHISRVREDGDFVVTVCDRAREELGPLAAVHWSVPDPVPAGDPGSFDAALAELAHRVERFVPRLAAT